MPAFTPPSPSASAARWTAHGLSLTDDAASLPATLDLAQPRRGLTVAAGIATAGAQLLGLDLRPDCVPTDHWVRGNDVTAVYESIDPGRLRTTAMWRLHPAAHDVRSWELVVSTQTSLLHSDPLLPVVSEIDAGDVLWGTCRAGSIGWHAAPTAEAACVLVSSAAAAGASVLLAVHPADARRIEAVRLGRRTRVECWLFPTVLEKGVLLRSRVLAAVGPAGQAAGWAAELAGMFAASPPILTT